MPKHTFTVYADLNCPFCFTLHERLLELGYMEQVDWRCIEHVPSAKYDVNDMHVHTELSNEVKMVREVAPEINIIIPPARPNSHLAIELTTQAFYIDPEKAIRFRTLVYRSLWQEGQDIGDPNLIERFRIECGLPEIVVTQQTRQDILDWYKEWNEGEFSRNIPAIVTDNGNKILGLPSVDVIEASLSEHAASFEEGAFCYLKPKEKILVASNND
ncbi:MAG: hypothetical protein R3240_13860, partial [Gammaproteobacteria bacterium]|nr:hypothetical protein [Gammaproteobacteria bacterium]